MTLAIDPDQQSVSVIKKGIATQLPPLKAAIDSDLTKEPIKSVELDGLSNLLTDSRVKAMIKSVAGTDTDNLIGQAVGAMNSSGSIEEKHKAFANGIKKLHSNFVDPQKQLLTKDDKTFDLAFSLVGLNRSALASFKNR